MASLGSDYYEKSSVVKGHHVYKAVWKPFWGEELSVQPEDHNDHDEHAIAVTRDGRTVGHVPRIISRVSWFFLRRGGHIICRIKDSESVVMAWKFHAFMSILGPLEWLRS